MRSDVELGGPLKVQMLGRLAVLIILIALIGIPILTMWEAILLGVGFVIVIAGSPKENSACFVKSFLVVLVVIVVKGLLPKANISEGHNIFLVIGNNEAIQRGLPSEIFASWKEQFDAIYPPDSIPYAERSQWRLTGVPLSLYAASTDAIWRKANYTRQVDSIFFRTLAEFRGGFSNELQYNFWTGELSRKAMPFYVMYELSLESVGSWLSWKGELFWEKENGEYERIVHEQIVDRQIELWDVGRRVYAVFFPNFQNVKKRSPDLHFEFKSSTKLKLSYIFSSLLELIGVIAVIGLTTRVRWNATVLSVGIFLISVVFIISVLAVSPSQTLGQQYAPHGGGDDGLAHDNWGRNMAIAFGQGKVLEALQGGEAVYWFTPGTRYVRMVEHLIFGDTNLLFTLLVAFVPVAVFWLLEHLTTAKISGGLTAIFFLLLAGNFSYVQYLKNAGLGYGESVGGLLFIVGLTLLLRAEPKFGGRAKEGIVFFVSGVALAGAMFIRPNFAIAVVFVGLMFFWTSISRRDVSSALALMLGLACALWMPFHNWYYGNEFYLISKSGTSVSLGLSVSDYYSALIGLLQGDGLENSAVLRVGAQLGGWLFNLGFVPHEALRGLAMTMQGIKIVSLVACGVVVVRALSSRKIGSARGLTVIAVTALCAHFPMLIIFSTHHRYAMLGWDLSLIVLFLLLLTAWQKLKSRVFKASPYI